MLALIAIATVTVAAACGSAGSTTTTGAAPPQSFASQRYGLRVTLPGNWSEHEATAEWDGRELPALDEPVGAYFTDTGPGRELVVVCAPTGMGLAGFRAAMHAAEVPHSRKASSSAAQTSLDGEPALMWKASGVDGYDLNNVAVPHRTHGYMIFLANPQLSNAVEDRGLFESIRRSFRVTR